MNINSQTFIKYYFHCLMITLFIHQPIIPLKFLSPMFFPSEWLIDTLMTYTYIIISSILFIICCLSKMWKVKVLTRKWVRPHCLTAAYNICIIKLLTLKLIYLCQAFFFIINHYLLLTQLLNVSHVKILWSKLFIQNACMLCAFR